MGLDLWCEDEAGPFSTIPYPGHHWSPPYKPERYPHEYVKNGTAKLLTLLHPADGRVLVKGVTSGSNAILHPWLKEQLTMITQRLPKKKDALGEGDNHPQWESWQEHLKLPFTLPEKLPSLRILLVLDNLSGHKSADLVLWLVEHGIMPLYTPLSGSWLNMAESIQNILKQRGLNGSYPKTTNEIISHLESTARGWNQNPTPFVWGGKRALRRRRAREKYHQLSGSGACTLSPLSRLRPKASFGPRAKRGAH